MGDLISIITPTFNCGKYIEETIQSVLSQTYSNWEMIIVDDCSTDNTEEIVSKYSVRDYRFKYHRLKANSGAAVARTVAMSLATGVYIAFLDSDDLWTSNKLETQMFFMKKKDINFSCTSYEQINENGYPLGKKIKCVSKVNYNRLLLDCPVGNSTVMYNVQNMGKFEVPNIRKRNDDALWLKMLKEEEFIHGIDEVMMKYRVRNNSISANKFDLIKYHWFLYREVEQLSITRSSFHVLYWIVIKILKMK